MNWHDRIHGDPSVLVGKPVIKGTRLSVEYLPGLLAEGRTVQEILESYPQLSQEALRATYAPAVECTRDEQVHTVSDGVTR